MSCTQWSRASKLVLGLAAGMLLVAPIRNPNYEQENFWGGNQGNGWGDCTLRIQEDPFCAGGYIDGDIDLFWYVECDENSCIAFTECEDGTPRQCEGAYKGQAGEGVVYCYDNGGGIHTDMASCQGPA